MKALARLAWGDEGDRIPDCKRCEFDASLRPIYGCDEPARTPVFYISCDCGQDSNCPRCEGVGKITMYRCPGKMLETHPRESPGVHRALRMFVHYDAHGVWPSAGGVADQAAALVTAFDVIGREKGILEEDARRKREAREKAARKRAQ